MFVLYLDDYHLGDPMFLTGLARDLQARHSEGGSGFVIVHGMGEAAERALEATGAIVRREKGALVLASPEARAQAERGARDLNRQIVHELSEAGVHAVRVSGMDRGLVQPDGSIGRVKWLSDLCAQRAVPVVLSIASGEAGEVREVAPAHFSALLAQKMEAEAMVVLGQPPEASGGDSVALSGAGLPTIKALQHMELGTVNVRVSRRASLRKPGLPEGVRIAASGV